MWLERQQLQGQSQTTHAALSSHGKSLSIRAFRILEQFVIWQQRVPCQCAWEVEEGKEQKDDIEDVKADERMDDGKAAEGEGEEAGREAIIAAQHVFGLCCYSVPRQWVVGQCLDLLLERSVRSFSWCR